MPCRPTIRRWLHSASSSPNSGNDRSGDAVRKTARRGSRSRSWPKIGSRNRIPFIHGQEYASPSLTQGGSRMRESRLYGSVRGALSNERPYRDPEAMRILRDELPNIEVSVSSQYSPDLAQALLRGKLDLAFMRREAQMPNLDYTVIVKEPLVIAMPSDHRLASQNAIALQDIADEIFIGMSNTAPTLQVVIDDYLN